MSEFDAAAKTYDDQFTFSIIGKTQRNQVWRYIHPLNLSRQSNVLEINCGTGEDAKRWKNLKFDIRATDLSPKMIEVAKTKFPEISFDVLDINFIENVEKNYNLLFSNFGGLNCLSKSELSSFFQKVHGRLPENGRMILVIMGKKCLWDKLFLVLKRRWKERNRRNTDNFIAVNVDGTEVKTWYYSPKEIVSMTGNLFFVEKLKPIGLFVPPSYLAKQFERKKVVISFFNFLDKLFSFRFLANYADHYLIVLKKRI